MAIDRDDEATSFDRRPWGGQQRLVPLANRFARDPNAPVAPPVQPPLARPAARRVASGSTSPVRPRPAPTPPAPTPAATPTVSLRAPDVHAMPTVMIDVQQIAVPTETQAALPTDLDVHALPIVNAQAVVGDLVSARAIPAFSVKYNCSLGGFVVPHIPRVAERYVDEPKTRRRSISKSIVIAPIGAVVAIVAIAALYLSQPKPVAEQTAGASSPEPARVLKMTER